jgi:hypothetical protein
MDWGGYLVAIAGSGGVGSLLTGVVMRKKTNADAASAISSAAMELVQELRNEIKELRIRIRELETEVASLRARELGQADGG